MQISCGKDVNQSWTICLVSVVYIGVYTQRTVFDAYRPSKTSSFLHNKPQSINSLFDSIFTYLPICCSSLMHFFHKTYYKNDRLIFLKSI